MLAPSPEAFAALARSSPWRWSTLRFTLRERRDGRWEEPVRAWLRRPDRVRVETADGDLLQVVHEPPQRIFELGSSGRNLPWPRDAGAPEPVWRPDGLVAERASGMAVSYDAPIYRDYFWVALLDPVELADGRDPAGGGRVPGTDIASLTEVEHAGRPAWEAEIRVTPAYEPRCSCCSMLRSRLVDEDMAAHGGPDAVLDEYPEAHRVRLDVGTGVCVLTEAVDGSPRGDGHEVRIEAVDEPMDDDLFAQ